MKIYSLQKIYEIPTYCAWCKKHMGGEDVGIDAEGVSHGICPECAKKVMQEKRE